jgi:trans-2,3-dihydro-3-hydroxyanthranilate isomerase
MTPRRVPMLQLDVFTSTPFEGNQLAVFPDARGLSAGEMQALARETNLSETTFVLPRAPEVEREKGVRVRIFTVEEELPFAGHPTLGTATVIRGASRAPEVTLDLDVGRVAVRFEDPPGGPAFGEMTQVDPVFGPRHEPQAVARALGLEPAALDPALPVETVSTGLPFTIVPLRSLAVSRALRFDQGRAKDYLAASGGKFFYFVTRETVDPAARLHARMIFYGGEDPATGSAAGCTAAWAVAHGVARPDERILIEQGLEIRRPSRIFVRAGKEGERVRNVRVGGSAVEVMRAEVSL